MPVPRRRTTRLASLPAGLSALFIVASVVLAGAAATTTVEAGSYRDYVAPDSGTATPGAITFGFTGMPEVIAADAELVPPADTNLAFLGGGTPTCLEVTREGGEITRLAFTAECTVTGTVTLVADAFGPGMNAYVIGDRVAAPAELVEGDPAFGALLGVPADSGALLSVTFQIDLTVGAPLSFVGATQVVGPVTMLAGGDVMVGAATLPGAAIDDASRALLSEAAALGVDATVGIAGDGTIEPKGQPTLELVLSVSYTAPTVAPTPMPVPTPAPTASALPDTSAKSTSPGDLIGWLILGLAALAALLVGARRWRQTVRR
jgi:hypothetical protein